MADWLKLVPLELGETPVQSVDRNLQFSLVVPTLVRQIKASDSTLSIQPPFLEFNYFVFLRTS